MSRWNVLVTGVAYVEVEADTCEDAEEKALYKVDPMTMQFESICEEEDRIKEEV